MDVTHFFLLSCLGLAITVQAQNCSRPTPGPNMDLKDEYIMQQSFADGSKVSFACNVGYTSAGGSPAITCSAGKWDSLKMTCIRKNCGSAGEVPNGQVDYPEGTEFGDKAVITCNPGYTLVGKNERICEDQGWSGRLPTCEVIICDPPPVMVNGSFSPNKDEYEYRDVVVYRCEKDYTLTGSTSITCSEDGMFKPEPPKCELIQCEHPAVDNADWTRRPPYRPLSTLAFQCRHGYSMKGERTQTCGLNGKWSPGLPTCERLMTTTTTTTTTKKPTKKPTGDDGDPDSIGKPSGGVVAGVVVSLMLGIVALIVAVVMCKRLKNKNRGSRRGSPNRADTKDEAERIALP